MYQHKDVNVKIFIMNDYTYSRPLNLFGYCRQCVIIQALSLSMNYLAHAYLSFADPDILTGNMISDFVKGKTRFDYSPGIQQGISLHRAIDRFTDEHEATKTAKEIFRPAYRLYSGALVDVVYDHFLAADEKIFSDNELKAFAGTVYAALDLYFPILPEKFRLMFPFMKRQNWLYNYRYRWGIEKSLGGVIRRAAYLTESETAFRLFNENYTTLQACYESFIKDVSPFARGEFEILKQT